MRTFGIDERVIRVARGERFELTAPAVPTGGFRWSVDSSSDAVRAVDSRFEHSADAVGGGARQHIVLDAVRAGVATLRLRYAQAGSASPREVRDVEVRVD